MDWLWKLLQFGMTFFQGAELSKQQDKFNAAVEEQIKQGTDILTARSRVAMQMIAHDPGFAQARRILETMPKEAREEVDRVAKAGKKNYDQFMAKYEKNTGDYLRENNLSTQAFLGKLETEGRGISDQYAKREADVMGLLEGQGEQALKDTQATFGRESAAALGDLAARGLSGSSVGASIRGGFSKEESDQLARVREQVAAQKAGALSSLRGDTLGFGERSMTLGAGFANEGITRNLNARAAVEAGRASYDAAMRGETMDRRSAALDRAYGFQGNLAGFYAGQGQNRLNTWLDTQGDIANYLGGGPVQNIPPDPSGFYNSIGSLGYGLLNRG